MTGSDGYEGHSDRVKEESNKVRSQRQGQTTEFEGHVIVTVNRVREYEHSDRQQGSRVWL